ncbi:hypothetical protein D3C81_353690 [compost metagenome]
MTEQQALCAALRGQTEAIDRLVVAMERQAMADVAKAEVIDRLLDYLCESEGIDDAAPPTHYLSGAPR